MRDKIRGHWAWRSPSWQVTLGLGSHIHRRGGWKVGSVGPPQRAEPEQAQPPSLPGLVQGPAQPPSISQLVASGLLGAGRAETTAAETPPLLHGETEAELAAPQLTRQHRGASLASRCGEGQLGGQRPRQVPPAPRRPRAKAATV